MPLASIRIDADLKVSMFLFPEVGPGTATHLNLRFAENKQINKQIY